MYKVGIYIETDSLQQASVKRTYGYVLTTTRKKDGEPHISAYLGKSEGTYHNTTLRALIKAFEKIKLSSEIVIYSRNTYVVANMKRLEELQASDFKDKKGQ